MKIFVSQKPKLFKSKDSSLFCYGLNRLKLKVRKLEGKIRGLNLAKFNGMIGNIDLVVCVKTYVRVGGRRNENKTPDLSKAFTILEQYSNDPQKHNELEAKLKSDRDYAYDLAARFEAGELQGIGKEKLESARKMLEEGMRLDVILRITGLSKKDLKDHGML